jgi:arginine decarboxylase
LKQTTTPLWSALRAYAQERILPFHTPGHKLHGGPFGEIVAALGEGFFNLDPSDEIENEDIGHQFETALEQAERLAAELFGASDSMFLVNGTTCGLHYLLMPTTGRVLIPRFSHQSVYSALILADAEADFIPASYDGDWLIPLPPTVEDVMERTGKRQYQALVLTHPTYYGTVSQLAELVRVAHERGVMVFVDEAHGGHFRFSKGLPPSGLACGADAVVQSTHKTLGSFTQTSMLHSANTQWFPKVVQAKQALQTTSPSLVFLAVLDAVRAVLAEQGKDLFGRCLALGQRAQMGIAAVPGVELLPSQLNSDPTKVVFSLRSLGLTGLEVERLLRRDYKIQVELSDYYNVLALISVGDTPASVEALIRAVTDLAERRSHLGGRPLPSYGIDVPALPPARLSLREAFFREKGEIPLEEAVGRVSGGFITPYPPGVPVIVPGEEFTPEICDYLRWCLRLGWFVRGIMAGENVVVLEDNRPFCRKTK